MCAETGLSGKGYVCIVCGLREGQKVWELMLKAAREKAGRKEPCGVWYLTRCRGWKKKGRKKHRGSLLKRMLESLGF